MSEKIQFEEFSVLKGTLNIKKKKKTKTTSF